MEELLKIIDSIADIIGCTSDGIGGKLDFSITQLERMVVIRISDASNRLGLHLSRRFVEMYDGRVDINHEANESGSSITVTVPLPDKNHLKSIQNRADNFAEKLILILEEHMENTEFNVTLLCRLLGMNKKLLYRKIKLLTGITPVQLIRRVRMTKAAALLSKEKFAVSEVMYMVGYSNPSYFSRCFMAEYGVPPSQYSSTQTK